jgi:hypothetical protein
VGRGKKMKENVDYALVPRDNESWDVRILTGDYIETTFVFGNLTIDEKSEMLNYNVDIMYSPDEDLTVSNTGFQEVTGQILHDILEQSLSNYEETTSNE